MNPPPNSPPDPPAAPAERNAKRKRLLWGLSGLTLLVLAAIAGWHERYGRWVEQTNDAYVQGNQVPVSARLAGTVVAIAADDGMQVARGQLLVQLDPSDAGVALQQAQANLARVVRQVRGLYLGVDVARADVSAREVALQRAQADFGRRRNLAASGAIAGEELAHARDELAAAHAAVLAALEALARSRALVDGTEIARHPEVQSAAAQVRQAYLDHARSRIVAPVSGVVARRSVQAGQRVQPGASLMAIVPPAQMWVEANFKETQLRRMHPGQKATVQADVYGSQITYDGRIESLGMGTGSAFSLLPAQNASGNWIKIVQRVPVRIRLDAQQLAQHPLRLGLSMSVSVSLREQDDEQLPVDSGQGATNTVFETDVFDRPLQEIDARIAQIIRDNLGQGEPGIPPQ